MSAISGESSGRGGGQAATWLPQLAKAWESNREFEIHWAVFDRSAAKQETKSGWNQTFHRIPSPSISASLLLGRLPHRIAARKLLNQIQPDLIHCWGTENLNSTALCHFKGPSILSMQGIITTYFQTGDLKGWRWKLFRYWEPISIRRATLVTCESQWGIERVNKIHPGKAVRQVEYGVNHSYYDVQWQPDPEQPRILFVGGLNRLKGIDIMLDMLQRHPGNPWKMVFVGDGYLAGSLRRLQDPSIEVLGMLKTKQVQEEMAKAWALVMPSRADTSPNVVKEARVIGLPVIGSVNGGHAEYIEHATDGYTIPSADPESWHSAIQSICNDYSKMKSLGCAKNEHFRDYFRPERTAEIFLETYADLLRKKSK